MNKEQRIINNESRSPFLVFCFLFFVFSLLLPSFALAQDVKQSPKVPETFEEVWSFVKKIIEPLPRAVKGVWQQAVEIWQRMANWFIDIWDSKIWPKVDWIWQKIFGIFNKEVEKRKEAIPRELEKEKQEIKEEVSKAGKNFWERLKGWIRK
ncbi:MAG TPA: hypothetical protein ENI19_01095 [Candidatus Nealsonbacteria bacterium]|uniref:Uncharacterized protein n=1 Tax=marine sediment metagenome TaxID=412755 RepID=A0A0F9VS09_9ZZZZ|nr:hypothetical protein [Candidatus Nealsonbacteria bacterium]HEB46289.1 hypothetical protein [Candidatus Nealsonbacteria bacterium]